MHSQSVCENVLLSAYGAVQQCTQLDSTVFLYNIIRKTTEIVNKVHTYVRMYVHTQVDSTAHLWEVLLWPGPLPGCPQSTELFQSEGTAPVLPTHTRHSRSLHKRRGRRGKRMEWVRRWMCCVWGGGICTNTCDVCWRIMYICLCAHAYDESLTALKSLCDPIINIYIHVPMWYTQQWYTAHVLTVPVPIQCMQ